MVLQSEKGFSLTKSDRNQLWDLWVDGAWKMWGGRGGGSYGVSLWKYIRRGWLKFEISVRYKAGTGDLFLV